jgi:hypothetical protein
MANLETDNKDRNIELTPYLEMTVGFEDATSVDTGVFSIWLGMRLDVRPRTHQHVSFDNAG